MGSWFSKPAAQEPSEKFQLQDGITLYDNEVSPCARRVRMTLIEKGASWNKVEIDLFLVEQKSPAFLAINPNGKVPALTLHNVKGLPDCCLYESNVITEFLDRVLPGIQLYPDDPWEKAQVKQWQEWELSLTDDFVPLMYSNTFAYALRAMYSSAESMVNGKNCSQQMLDKYKKLYDDSYLTQAEVEQMAIACYKNLLILEEGLENKEFLVGGHFTTADLSVVPRVQMFDMVGLPITKQHFPNVRRYLDSMNSRPCFRQSQSRQARVMSFAMSYLPSVLVTMGNWRSRKKHTRFDGSTVVDRVVADYLLSTSKESPALSPLCEEFLVYDYPTAAECLQMKVLLREKGAAFTTTPCDYMDLIGRPNGSGGLFRLQHRDRLITGNKTILDYINNVADGKSLYPGDPKLKADCQCWQAWDQTMNWMELSIFFEMCVISQKLHERFTSDTIDELLGLKDDVKFAPKSHRIMELFMSRVSEGSALAQKLSDYSDLILTEADKEKTRVMYHELLTSRLQHLEKELQGKDYLVGEEVTIADIAVYSRLLVFPLVGLPVTSHDHPNIAAWMDRLKLRDSFQTETASFDNIMKK